MQGEINLVDKVKEEILEKIVTSFDTINLNNNTINDYFQEKQSSFLEKISELEESIKILESECKQKDKRISDLSHDLENMNKFSYTKKLDKLLTEEKRDKEIIIKKYNFLLKENHKLKAKKKSKPIIKENQNNKQGENVDEEVNNISEDEEDHYNIFEYKGKEFFLKVEDGNHIIYQKNKQNRPGKNIGYMKNGKIYKKKNK